MENCKFKLLNLINRHAPITREVMARYVNVMLNKCYDGVRCDKYKKDLKGLMSSKLVDSYTIEQPEKRGRNPEIYICTPKGKQALQDHIDDNDKKRKAVK